MGYNIVYKYVNEDKTSALTKYLLYTLLSATNDHPTLLFGR